MEGEAPAAPDFMIDVHPGPRLSGSFALRIRFRHSI
jgi:hypothetical protein